MNRLVLITALAAGIVGVAHAGAAVNADKPNVAKNGNACVFINTVGNYQSLDKDKLVIWAPGRRDAYLVELSMPLFGMKGSWQMAMIDHDRDGRLCGFSSDRIGIRDFGYPESASIKSMTRLDDAAIAALEKQYDVSLTRKKKDESKDDSKAG